MNRVKYHRAGQRTNAGVAGLFVCAGTLAAVSTCGGRTDFDAYSGDLVSGGATGAAASATAAGRAGGPRAGGPNAGGPSAGGPNAAGATAITGGAAGSAAGVTFGGFGGTGGVAGAPPAGGFGGGVIVPPAQGGAAGAPSAGAPSAGAPPTDTCSQELSSPVRLLTRRQHNHALTQLLGDGLERTVPSADRGEAGVWQDIAEVARSRAETADLSQIVTCDPNQDEQCAEEFVSEFVQVAYRRELGSDEADVYWELYLENEDFRDLVEATLLSPYFNYEIALGSIDVATLPTPPQAAAALSAQEYATRLAFFLWDQPADSALYERSRDLYATPIGRTQLIGEMLADDRATEGAMALAERWLELEQVSAGDNPGGGGLSNELASDARRETELFFAAMLRDGDNVETLLSQPESYLSQGLAAHYGVSGGGADFPLVLLPENERSGLLTQTSVLSLHPSIPTRGAWIRDTFFCTQIPPIPADFMIDRSDLTVDQYLSAVSDPVCWGCHAFMGPIGLSFTSYDPIGRYRTEFPDGSPVQLEGELTDTDVDGEYVGPRGLAERLGASQQVHSCIADSWLGLATGRRELDCFASLYQPAVGLDLMQVLAEVASHEMLRLVPETGELQFEYGYEPWELAMYEAIELSDALTGESSAEMRAYADWLEQYGESLEP